MDTCRMHPVLHFCAHAQGISSAVHFHVPTHNLCHAALLHATVTGPSRRSPVGRICRLLILATPYTSSVGMKSILGVGPPTSGTSLVSTSASSRFYSRVTTSTCGLSHSTHRSCSPHRGPGRWPPMPSLQTHECQNLIPTSRRRPHGSGQPPWLGGGPEGHSVPTAH